MNRKMKLKDILLIALLTAVYMLVAMLSMTLLMPLGPFGHAISTGVYGFFSGIILYFMSHKVGKIWQFSLMTLLVMGVFALMGGGYLPWFLTSMTMSVAADFLASRQEKPQVWKIAVASGLMHVGQAWGAILPSLFFVNKYRETWIQRGQTPEDMDAMIHYTSGMWALYSTVIVFVLAFSGVYIGYWILRKHFQEK